MSHADIKAAGMSGGPSSNKIDPLRLFIVGHDGEGNTEAERIDWLRAKFPKLAARFKSEDNDPRSNLPIREDEIRVFRPAHAKPVVYESMGVKFGDDAGRWSGLNLLVVNTGRQTVKVTRIINERRDAAGSPQIEIVVIGKRYASALDRLEANICENRQIKPTSPTERAWGAHRLIENGATREDAMALCGVSTEQGLKNLLGLLDCSTAVQAAVDLGVDAGGITQTAGLDIAKKRDHAEQDAELAKRLAAAGQAGGKRERSAAIRGESGGESKSKPVSGKVLAKVETALAAADRTKMDDPHRVDEWRAIVAWARGDEGWFDALPADFLAAVIAAEKPKSKVKPAKVEAPSAEPANDAGDAVEEREAA